MVGSLRTHPLTRALFATPLRAACTRTSCCRATRARRSCTPCAACATGAPSPRATSPLKHAKHAFALLALALTRLPHPRARSNTGSRCLR
jgi:hypothetical protein